jgi:hypothetical protein
MKAMNVAVRRRRWMAAIVLIILTVGTWFFVQISPSIARQRAANELRRMGLTIGVDPGPEAAEEGLEPTQLGTAELVEGTSQPGVQHR